MRKTVLCGIDIGTSKICCAIAEHSVGEPLLLRSLTWTTHQGVRVGHVVDLHAVADAIQSVLAQAEAAAGLRARQCVIGVSVPQLESRTVRGMIPLADHGVEIRSRDIERVRLQAEVTELALDRAILHSIPVTFSIDGDIDVDDPVGLVGHQLAMHVRLFTCPHSVLQNLSKAVQLAGLEVQQCVYNGLATASALRVSEDLEHTALMIDVGGTVTDCTLLQQGRVVSALTLPLGGDHLTQAIADQHHLALDEAESLKREAGLARDGDIDRLIAREAAILFEQVAVKTQPLLSQVNHVDYIIVTGRTALLDGLLEVAEAQFRVPVRLGRVTLPAAHEGREQSVLATTAIGLLHHALPQQTCAPASDAQRSWSQRFMGKARTMYEEYF